ncbi:hypothetical protein CEXT_60181 [Caerostris extrusa]|uniref:Uncharacterized protein n=1 Tax=Caerostris extrusa TaxID=172846 RepID=A0AAV4P497_CAEEX|nr:hypothetical protein CEXT_60181 [Caerostris extrusa]
MLSDLAWYLICQSHDLDKATLRLWNRTWAIFDKYRTMNTLKYVRLREEGSLKERTFKRGTVHKCDWAYEDFQTAEMVQDSTMCTLQGRFRKEDDENTCLRKSVDTLITVVRIVRRAREMYKLHCAKLSVECDEVSLTTSTKQLCGFWNRTLTIFDKYRTMNTLKYMRLREEGSLNERTFQRAIVQKCDWAYEDFQTAEMVQDSTMRMLQGRFRKEDDENTCLRKSIDTLMTVGRIVRRLREIHELYCEKLPEDFEETACLVIAKVINKVVEKYLQSMGLRNSLKFWRDLEKASFSRNGDHFPFITLKKQLCSFCNRTLTTFYKYRKMNTLKYVRLREEGSLNQRTFKRAIVQKCDWAYEDFQTAEMVQDSTMRTLQGRFRKEDDKNTCLRKSVDTLVTVVRIVLIAKVGDKVVEKYLQSMGLSNSLKFWRDLYDWFVDSREIVDPVPKPYPLSQILEYIRFAFKYLRLFKTMNILKYIRLREEGSLNERTFKRAIWQNCVWIYEDFQTAEIVQDSTMRTLQLRFRKEDDKNTCLQKSVDTLMTVGRIVRRTREQHKLHRAHFYEKSEETTCSVIAKVVDKVVDKVVVCITLKINTGIIYISFMLFIINQWFPTSLKGLVPAP